MEAEHREHSETSWSLGREVCKPHASLAKARWFPSAACPGRELQLCKWLDLTCAPGPRMDHGRGFAPGKAKGSTCVTRCV